MRQTYRFSVSLQAKREVCIVSGIRARFPLASFVERTSLASYCYFVFGYVTIARTDSLREIYTYIISS